MTSGPNTESDNSEGPSQSPPRRYDAPGSPERTPPPNADSATGIEGLDFIMRRGKLHRLLTVVKSRGMPTADYVSEYAMTPEGVVRSGPPQGTGVKE